MHIINREDLYNQLESVRSGLSSKEVIEQSGCFVFKDGEVITFNDELCCHRECLLGQGITGAVQADPLLQVLSKLKEDELKVGVQNNQLIFQGKGRRAGINIATDIVLPLDGLEKPANWAKLNPKFVEAVSLVEGCASKDSAQFAMTCVHITPKWVEACDNYQAARYPLVTGFQRPICVRSESIASITTEEMDSVSETDNWVHFKNPVGLIISCRRYLQQYPVLSAMFTIKGDKIALPKGLDDALDKANIFSSERKDQNNVIVTIGNGKLSIRGEGATGFYEERRPDKSYKGDPLSFLVDPKLLAEISSKYNSGIINESNLLIDTGKLRYVTTLGTLSE